MARRDLTSIVDRIVDLPTLPQVVSTIMSLLDDPDSSAKDINDVMANDPALASKILKLVNSAFYGLPNSVTSIQQAIAILGFNTIKSLAISSSVFDLFGVEEGDFSYEGFWTHSVGSATVARLLAAGEPGVNRDTAFVVGLLHGIGRLILDQYAPMEFQEIISIAREEELSFAAAEQRVIDTSCADIGFWVASKWKLADDVQYAIKYQDRIGECPEKYRQLTAVLAFSVYICRLRNYGSNGDFNKPQVPREAWEMLHLEKDDLPELMGKIKDELQKAEGFLAVIRG